jgi:hypothetical protein
MKASLGTFAARPGCDPDEVCTGWRVGNRRYKPFGASRRLSEWGLFRPGVLRPEKALEL